MTKTKALGIELIVLLSTAAFFPLCEGAFILPPQGGGMVHCDPQMSENIKVSLPKNNLTMVWYAHSFGGEKFGTWGNGIVGNGNIAAVNLNNYLGPDNLIIYDYFGNRLWSSGTWRIFNPQYPWSLSSESCASSPMVDIHDRVVSCDDRHIILVNASDHSNIHVDWVSDIPHIIPFYPLPISPSIVESRTIILPSSKGPVLAYDEKDGTLLASMKLGKDLTGYYSTTNSACVQGNRVFLVCTKSGKSGRLYAVDVFPDATPKERLKVAWYYDYSRKSHKSQATPTIIGDAVYFDGYNASLNISKRDPYIYAVYASNGTEKWSRPYDNITWYTFTADPRGGFWYKDTDPITRTGGNRLVRFSEADGRQIEAIDMKELLNEQGPYRNSPIMPGSDMTIFGNATDPVMLISANHMGNAPGKWVLAVKLQYNDTTKTGHNIVLWKVALNETIHNTMNYANGDYIPLIKDGQIRILFSTWLGGVVALGTPSLCRFQDIHYKTIDSSNDTFNDTAQITFTIKASLPDKVVVKAHLISIQYPFLFRYTTQRFYNITTEITGCLNATLPLQAPKGKYMLQVFLYNSTGEMYRSLATILVDRNGHYANDTYNPKESLYLYPYLEHS
jgi:outer membrane protein assembly factor BamB